MIIKLLTGLFKILKLYYTYINKEKYVWRAKGPQLFSLFSFINDNSGRIIY